MPCPGDDALASVDGVDAGASGHIYELMSSLTQTAANAKPNPPAPREPDPKAAAADTETPETMKAKSENYASKSKAEAAAARCGPIPTYICMYNVCMDVWD